MLMCGVCPKKSAIEPNCSLPSRLAGKCKVNRVFGMQGLTLKRHIDATLGSGNMREAVKLPKGEDLNEWLAVNTVDFYNALGILYGTLEENCTSVSCPIMSASPKVQAKPHASSQPADLLQGQCRKLLLKMSGPPISS